MRYESRRDIYKFAAASLVCALVVGSVGPIELNQSSIVCAPAARPPARANWWRARICPNFSQWHARATPPAANWCHPRAPGPGARARAHFRRAQIICAPNSYEWRAHGFNSIWAAPVCVCDSGARRYLTVIAFGVLYARPPAHIHTSRSTSTSTGAHWRPAGRHHSTSIPSVRELAESIFAQWRAHAN